MPKKQGVKKDLQKLEVLATGLKKLADGHFTVQIGIFGDKGARENTVEKTSKAARKSAKNGLTNAEVGLIQEMGSVSRGIPRRSFLWDTFSFHLDKVTEALAPSAKALFESGKVELYLKEVGIASVNLVLDAFDTSGWGSWKPNAASTIAQKGSSKPLIDTSQLLQAVDSRVGKVAAA